MAAEPIEVLPNAFADVETYFRPFWWLCRRFTLWSLLSRHSAFSPQLDRNYSAFAERILASNANMESDSA